MKSTNPINWSNPGEVKNGLMEALSEVPAHAGMLWEVLTHPEACALVGDADVRRLANEVVDSVVVSGIRLGVMREIAIRFKLYVNIAPDCAKKDNPAELKRELCQMLRWAEIQPRLLWEILSWPETQALLADPEVLEVAGGVVKEMPEYRNEVAQEIVKKFKL